MCHGLIFKLFKQENGQIHRVSNVSDLSNQRLYSRADAVHSYTQTKHLNNHVMLLLNVQF